MNKSSGRTTVVFFSALLFLVLFHPRWTFFDINKYFWALDDGCYLQILGRFVRGDFPLGSCQASENYFSIGAPLLWIPAALLARISAFLFSGTFSEWTIAWISVESYLAWVLATVLLERFIALCWPNQSPGRRALEAIALGIASSAFYYATHRQVMAHPVEWLFACALILSLKSGHAWRALIFAAGLTLIRYNDFPAFLLVIGMLADTRDLKRFDRRFWISSSVVVAGGLTYIGWLAFGHGYGGVFLTDLLKEFRWSEVFFFFVGLSWGILWTAPWFLAMVILGIPCFPRLSWVGRAAYLWIIAEVLLCILWNGNGSMFAYRYLTGSFVAAFWVMSEIVSGHRRIEKFSWNLLGFSALWSLILAHFYKGMLLLEIGVTMVRNAQGIERRIQTLPFFSTAMAQWGNFQLHKEVLQQQSPLFVWIASLTDADTWPAVMLVEGPTLFLLTLLNATVLIGLALFLTQRRKK